MSKIFDCSALTAAFLSILITLVGLSVGSYLTASKNAQIKAQDIIHEQDTSLTKQEINNLIIAAFVGEIANIKSDKKAIEIKRKAEVVLASYRLSNSHHYYKQALFSD